MDNFRATRFTLYSVSGSWIYFVSLRNGIDGDILENKLTKKQS